MHLLPTTLNFICLHLWCRKDWLSQTAHRHVKWCASLLQLFYFTFLSQSKVRKAQSQKDEGHEKQEVEKKMKAETLKANETEGNEVHWVSNYLSSSQGIVFYSSNVHIWCQFTVTPSENLNMIYTNRSGREIKTSKIQIFFCCIFALKNSLRLRVKM